MSTINPGEDEQNRIRQLVNHGADVVGMGLANAAGAGVGYALGGPSGAVVGAAFGGATGLGASLMFKDMAIAL